MTFFQRLGHRLRSILHLRPKMTEEDKAFAARLSESMKLSSDIMRQSYENAPTWQEKKP
jgi:hypothetical protein